MTTTNAPAVKNDEKPTLAQLIQRMRPEIARALPNQMNPDRMARIATTVIRQTPILARCTPESFLGALLTASQLGLEPGPIGEAYLVPFRDGRSGDYQCQFIPGYRGLIKLARNSGQLKDIWAEVVFANDTFRYSLGLHRDLVHEPAAGDRGKPVAVYAAAQLVDGGTPFVVMTVDEVEAIRARSKASKNGPWVTGWAAMAKKTVVKQLMKWLPLSAEVAAAATLDGSVRTDIGALTDVTPTFIDGEVMGDQGDHDEPPAVEETSSPEAETPPAGEVMMASRKQLAQLKQIRDAEKYDADSDWFGFLTDMLATPINRAADITAEQADRILATFATAVDAGAATEQEN